MTPQEITNSLQNFKDRRDDLMHEDVNGFDHLAGRFLDFCQNDALMQTILNPLKERFSNVEVNQWWESGRQSYQIPDFPADKDADLILRYKILESVRGQRAKLFEFGELCNHSKFDEAAESFRSLVLRPMMSELSRKFGEVANIATPEAREVQAVPLNRIPSPKEIGIFLSHKNKNKDMVWRYYYALKEAGFAPWLDEPNMAAGAELERELLRGFDESCAAVFFLTEHFKDENYLASEITYAIQQKRKKGKKFAIITLRYPNANEVPGLLTPYLYKTIENDLDGFREIIRGLPIELGSARWKKEVIE